MGRFDCFFTIRFGQTFLARLIPGDGVSLPQQHMKEAHDVNFPSVVWLSLIIWSVTSPLRREFPLFVRSSLWCDPLRLVNIPFLNNLSLLLASTNYHCLNHIAKATKWWLSSSMLITHIKHFFVKKSFSFLPCPLKKNIMESFCLL